MGTYIHTYGQTYIHTYRGPKQGKPGRNRNSSQGSVLVSGHYWFVKQCWLVNITGLYRVQVSEKYRFLPQRFNNFSDWGGAPFEPFWAPIFQKNFLVPILVLTK